MDKTQFDILTKKLDSITNLLAFSLIQNKSVSEQIETLTKAGLKVSEIALFLDKTENQIYVTQTQLRKKNEFKYSCQFTDTIEENSFGEVDSLFKCSLKYKKWNFVW